MNNLFFAATTLAKHRPFLEAMPDASLIAVNEQVYKDIGKKVYNRYDVLAILYQLKEDTAYFKIFIKEEVQFENKDWATFLIHHFNKTLGSTAFNKVHTFFVPVNTFGKGFPDFEQQDVWGVVKHLLLHAQWHNPIANFPTENAQLTFSYIDVSFSYEKFTAQIFPQKEMVENIIFFNETKTELRICTPEKIPHRIKKNILWRGITFTIDIHWYPKRLGPGVGMTEVEFLITYNGHTVNCVQKRDISKRVFNFPQFETENHYLRIYKHDSTFYFLEVCTNGNAVDDIGKIIVNDIN